MYLAASYTSCTGGNMWLIKAVLHFTSKMLLWVLLSFLALAFAYDDDIRIVGGTPVHPQARLYQLSLERKHFGSYAHTCGAAIISRWWAVTAAHCVQGYLSRFMRLRSGSKFIGVGKIHQVNRIIIHHKFDTNTRDFDIALLQVSEQFKLGRQEGIKAISLATETPEPDSTGTISGWGSTQVNGSSSGKLMKAKLTILDPIICQYEYPLIDITDSMLCAAANNYRRDSCQGDSGGPLVVDHKLVGVISWAEGCAQKHKPGVNVNVAAVRGWILATTGLGIRQN